MDTRANSMEGVEEAVIKQGCDEQHAQNVFDDVCETDLQRSI